MYKISFLLFLFIINLKDFIWIFKSIFLIIQNYQYLLSVFYFLFVNNPEPITNPKITFASIIPIIISIMTNISPAVVNG